MGPKSVAFRIPIFVRIAELSNDEETWVCDSPQHSLQKTPVRSLYLLFRVTSRSADVRSRSVRCATAFYVLNEGRRFGVNDVAAIDDFRNAYVRLQREWGCIIVGQTLNAYRRENDRCAAQCGQVLSWGFGLHARYACGPPHLSQPAGVDPADQASLKIQCLLENGLVLSGALGMRLDRPLPANQ